MRPRNHSPITLFVVIVLILCFSPNLSHAREDESVSGLLRELRKRVDERWIEDRIILKLLKPYEDAKNNSFLSIKVQRAAATQMILESQTLPFLGSGTWLIMHPLARVHLGISLSVAIISQMLP
jgi:hypothetical protein